MVGESFAFCRVKFVACFLSRLCVCAGEVRAPHVRTARMALSSRLATKARAASSDPINVAEGEWLRLLLWRRFRSWFRIIENGNTWHWSCSFLWPQLGHSRGGGRCDFFEFVCVSVAFSCQLFTAAAVEAEC